MHCASLLYWWVRAGKPCICNFPLALDRIRGRKSKEFIYVNNNDLTPKFLIEFANEHRGERVEEESLLLVIDEAQMLFNSRDWGKQGRDEWLNFFTIHGHLGYRIVLIAQYDRMLDRQIRSLIEYEYVHRKVSNIGWKGKLLSLFSFGNLFLCVKVWYPMKERVGSEFFRAKKFYYDIYDSYGEFTAPD